MMRAVDWRRSAVIVLCLLGYFVPRAVAKTLREDTATEGEDAFLCFLRWLCSVNPLVSRLLRWLIVPLARSDADVTQT